MILPQLAQNCESDRQLERMFTDDQWVAEQKLDGKRVLIVAGDNDLAALNRKGERIDVPAYLRVAFERFSSTNGKWVVDGELIGDSLWLFDLPVAMTTILPTDPYDVRREALEGIYEAAWADNDHVHLLDCYRTQEEKRDLYAWCKANHAEGLMFKNRRGTYHEGRRSSDLQKVKFTETVDCIILETWREGRRSIRVGLYENGTMVDVGAITMTEENLAIATVGQVVEARYLYVAKDRRLYQPRFLGFRDDKSPDECTIDQLKFTSKEIRTVTTTTKGNVT